MAGNGTRDPVGRALDLLTWLAEHGTGGPIGVREIARDMGTSPSTVHRLLQTFEERSLVRRDGSGAYVGGLELVRLGRLASRFSVQAAVRPVLERLAATVGETSTLALFDPGRGEVMCVDCVQTNHPLRYIVELNTWRPLHAGAAGLAVLAFLEPGERAKRLEQGDLKRITQHTLTTVTEIEEFCARSRQHGYALSQGHRIDGAVGMAAPIRDADGQVVGDVCLSFPGSRFKAADERRYATALIAASAETSGLLAAAGYRLAAVGPDLSPGGSR
jgi:IclR family transcriptional regulator, acetate operon repressor